MKDLERRLYELAAERSVRRAAYLGRSLGIFMEAEGLRWEQLAKQLNTTATYEEVALCLGPRPDHFAEDIRALSDRLGMNDARLAHVIRASDAIAAMRESPDAEHAQGTLLAARERRSDEDDPPGA